MNQTARTAARVLFLSVMIVSMAAVGQSLVAATTVGASDEPGAATPRPDGAGSEAAGGGSSADDDGPATVNPGFEAASERTLPSENWSASRVRAAADGDRNLTVVATQGFYVSDERAELAAFTSNGTVVYYDDSYRVYFDVDPVPDERYTVEYVGAEHFSEEHCDEYDFDTCTRNVVTRVNLTTGEEELVYSEVTPRVYSARWHDVDRLDEHTIVIADIVNDGVYAVDTRDGSTLWRWNASENYDEDQGGASGDWTHVNDVEVLADGRVMASVRNMDSVVFLEPRGDTYVMNESATLGVDDRHGTLYEQHNPDYVPADRGGPAVIVADSENRRLVEFSREGGQWLQTWEWRDARLQWPRDADRLPNGNTLVVDTHGDRVVELGPNDRVVWTAEVGMAYDVERIGTGDESAGGPAAGERTTAANGGGSDGETGASGGGAAASSSDPTADRFWMAVKDVTPSLVANGLLYVGPSWVRFTDLAFTAVFLLTGSVWGSAELYWSRYTLRGAAGRALRRVAGVGRRFVPRRLGP